ncbi:hypothetical protein NUU61_002255 [Penicillium alfredii]|uniref:Uncharacterized protein n=1 Tax=Penicillium alfredii TaxID=1506179 RepID=A0A9W9KGP7_9EURO|nr:uncharacterized protein NUU61_002255 [Penicillium alfredii]KAJ5104908.1 hypothetical protein NUU61_002255 [Penicillium alfredii]
MAKSTRCLDGQFTQIERLITEDLSLFMERPALNIQDQEILSKFLSVMEWLDTEACGHEGLEDEILCPEEWGQENWGDEAWSREGEDVEVLNIKGVA